MRYFPAYLNSVDFLLELLLELLGNGTNVGGLQCLLHKRLLYFFPDVGLDRQALEVDWGGSDGLGKPGHRLALEAS